MKNILLTLCLALVAVLPLNNVSAATGVASSSVHQLESPVEGLTISQIVETPVKQLNEVAGRKLTYKEKAAARKIKRLNKKFQAPQNPDGVETTSIVALATGAGGLLFLFLPGIGLVGFLACIVGVIFGSISLKKFKRGTNVKEKGRGMGLAGMICGIVGLGIVVLGVLFIAALFAV